MSEELELSDDQRRQLAFEQEEERRRQSAKVGIEQLSITVGAAIPANTTIDALFAALFATRSADITAAGTPTYSWGSGNQIIAQWPALQVGSSPAVPNYSAMWATFHARSDTARGSSIAQ